MNEFNLIVAGVGGQGILTIAALVAQVAIRRGWQVKQSEVHGMSQRGGAVQAHVRMADHPIHSELIPVGTADMIIAAEPLEALRYVEYLNPRTGAIVASSVPLQNISDYPAPGDLLKQIRASASRHVIIDAPGIARSAGAARAENVVMLGAAAAWLPFSQQELLDAVETAFASKGERVVEINQLACRMGRDAATRFTVEREEHANTANWSSIEELLRSASAAGRTQLFEHEVYRILHAAGCSPPPAHRFIPAGQSVSSEDLSALASYKLVMKIVSPQAVHKSEDGGVTIIPHSVEAVNAAARKMESRYREHGATVAGVLIEDFIEHNGATLGSELLVGLRWTREFGPIIAAGLGGLHTEYLASRLQPGAAVAMAPTLETSAEEFFELFARTAAWELISGAVRGTTPRATREDLIRCFQAFVRIANHCCLARDNAPALIELEVNPVAVVDGRLTPLDGRGRIGPASSAAPMRCPKRLARLLEPRSIAIMGVSTQRMNFGRIILNNTQAFGFPTEHLYVIKDNVDQIDGVRCVPSIAKLPEPVDLLVAATGADQVPKLVDEVLNDGAQQVGSVILISAGIGEKDGTADLQQSLRDAIHKSRSSDPGAEGPVFLGANSMGVVSRPGRYDTFFIPPEKLDPHRDVQARRLALISQSGAFIVTRTSNMRFLDPAIAVSLGNQLDVTASDMMHVVARRNDIDCIGVYVEGFNDLDGIEFARSVRAACGTGKTVVFYKAGRTPAGRAAAQGHTASLAGDWHACCAALRQAGALVADSFGQCERLIELATLLHAKTIGGSRIAAISNAGFETVGMADNAGSSDLAVLTAPTLSRLSTVLETHHLARLVNPRNPLDLTPMADDKAYEDCIQVLLDAPEVDAAVIGCVPLSPQLLTTPGELDRPGAIAWRIIDLFRRSTKPLVFVIDCGPPYDVLADTIRCAGVPVFQHADEAMITLQTYLRHRTRNAV